MAPKTKTKSKTETLPDKDMERFLKKAFSALLLDGIYGSSRASVSLSELHDDGRTAKKYARILCEQGLISERDREFAITEKVLDLVTPEEPDLIAMLQSNEYLMGQVASGSDHYVESYGQSLNLRGWGEDGFTSAQLAYILQNHDEFRFGHFANQTHESHAWGTSWDGKVAGHSWSNSSLLVTNDSCDNFVYELQFSSRVEGLYYQNVSWGLQSLCGVSEDDASFISSGRSSSRNPFGGVGGSGPFFSEEKADWSVEMREAVASSENALAYHTRKLEALSRVGIAVAKYGGWGKFQTDYKARIEEHLREQDAESED